jgi:hypothetical protein
MYQSKSRTRAWSSLLQISTTRVRSWFLKGTECEFLKCSNIIATILSIEFAFEIPAKRSSAISTRR